METIIKNFINEIIDNPMSDIAVMADRIFGQSGSSPQLKKIVIPELAKITPVKRGTVQEIVKRKTGIDIAAQKDLLLDNVIVLPRR